METEAGENSKIVFFTWREKLSKTTIFRTRDEKRTPADRRDKERQEDLEKDGKTILERYSENMK